MKKISIFALMLALLAGCGDFENKSVTVNTYQKITDSDYSYINSEHTATEGESVFSTRRLGLTKANTCETYHSYLLDAAAAEIAQYHFDNHYYYVDEAMDMAAVPSANNDSESNDNSAGEYTTTNVQEENVDEADIVKNDGEWMYVLRGDEVKILKAWPAEDMHKVAEIQLGSAYGNGMFLTNDKLVILSQDYSGWSDSNYRSAVKIGIYDVANPSQPVLLHEHRIEGYYTDSRLIDGKVYVVVNNWLQAYTWDMIDDIPGVPNYQWEVIEKLSDKQRQKLIEKYTPIIRAYLEKNAPTIESLHFPKYSNGVITQNAVSCDNIYLPNTSSVNHGILMVAEISGDNLENYTSGAVADDGWNIYASTNNVYLVSTSSNWYWRCWDDESCMNYSQIHRFSLENGLKYVASGEVEGYVSDPYWMSEYNGYLRVASDYLKNWSNTDGSALSVLDIDTMKQVGRVTGIAPNEEIYAARMFGNKGYLVTFRNTDPLFTIDLSQPEKPVIKGKLEINGYSSYIHPLGEDALLTIGRDGDESGNIKGVQLQIFDVSDLSKPKQLHKVVITRENEDTYSYSAALWDTHAFMYHAGSGLLSLPINMYHWSWAGNSNFSGAVVYKATRDEGFSLVGLVNHIDLLPPQGSDTDYYYHWWTQLDRSRFMFRTAGVYDQDAYLYTISDAGVKASNALNPSETFSSVKF